MMINDREVLLDGRHLARGWFPPPLEVGRDRCEVERRTAVLQGEDRCSSSGPGGVVVAGVVLVEVVVVHLVVVHVSGTGWVENNLSAEIENLRDLGLPPGLVL